MSGRGGTYGHESAAWSALPAVLIVDHEAGLTTGLARAFDGLVPVVARGTLAEAHAYLAERRELCALITRKTLRDGRGRDVVRTARSADPTLPCLKLIAELSPADPMASLFAGATAIGRGPSTVDNISVVVEFLHLHLRPAQRHRIAAARLVTGARALSPREVACTAAAMEGRSPTATAAAMGIRPRTVHNLLVRSREKLGVERRSQLVARALKLSESLFDDLRLPRSFEQPPGRTARDVELDGPRVVPLGPQTHQDESDTRRSRTRLKAIRDADLPEESDSPRRQMPED